MSAAGDVQPQRDLALDGLRGIAIVLVTLGHGNGNLWPPSARELPGVGGFLAGGAVSMFFVIGAFLVTKGLLAQYERGTMDPILFLVRRVVRIGAQLGPLLLAIVLVRAWDQTDTSTWTSTLKSVTNALTYTYNIFLARDPLGARGDLAHLWYLGPLQQFYLVLPLLILAFGSRRRIFAFLLIDLFVALTVYRIATLDPQNWLPAFVGLERFDGILLGTAIAAVVPRLSSRASWMPALLLAGIVGILVLLGIGPHFGDLRSLDWWGTGITLACGLAVAALAGLATPSRGARLLALPGLVTLGRASLALYLWQLPLFALVARHTTDWTWLPRTLLAFAVLAVVGLVTTRLIEEPTRRWLATHLRGSGSKAPVAA